MDHASFFTEAISIETCIQYRAKEMKAGTFEFTVPFSCENSMKIRNEFSLWYPGTFAESNRKFRCPLGEISSKLEDRRIVIRSFWMFAPFSFPKYFKQLISGHFTTPKFAGLVSKRLDSSQI